MHDRRNDRAREAPREEPKPNTFRYLIKEFVEINPLEEVKEPESKKTEMDHLEVV